MRNLELQHLARRAQLTSEVPAANLAGRALTMAAGQPWYGARFADRPRAGNGRYLSQAWLDQAESYTPADTAWFRAPIR